jgi:hypothetical protein
MQHLDVLSFAAAAASFEDKGSPLSNPQSQYPLLPSSLANKQSSHNEGAQFCLGAISSAALQTDFNTRQNTYTGIVWGLIKIIRNEMKRMLWVCILLGYSTCVVGIPFITRGISGLQTQEVNTLLLASKTTM